MNNQNHGQKMPRYEGADGKLYFNYAQGLKVLMREGFGANAEQYTLEVVGCHYSNDTEYYELARDGVKQPFEVTANRVRYLLSRNGVKTLAAGKRVELPLILEEVRRFYSHERNAFNRKLAQAEAIPEYKALQYELRGFGYKLGVALAHERADEIAALQKKQFDINRRIEAVLRSHGLTLADLQENKCEKCGGNGFHSLGICDCAIKQADKIKTFCVAERLRLRKLAGGNGGN